jgi:uncharacterized membrane protein YcjF (UPF0283 family)
MGLIRRLAAVYPYAAKGLDFLHLMEDNMTRLSLTGAQMWVTTVLNIHTQIVSHDHVLQGMTLASNATAMVAHGAKRSQTLKADQEPDEPDPPWKGEAD